MESFIFFLIAAALRGRAATKNARRFARRASFRLVYKIKSGQDPAHTNHRVMMMVVADGGGH